MFTLPVFRLGNSLLLGLIGLLTGSVFFLSHSAHGDSYGTDCPPNWSYISGFCFGDDVYEDTGQTSCATSPSGLCCTYEGFKIVCSLDGSVVGTAYSLNKAGQDGYYYKCSATGCMRYS